MSIFYIVHYFWISNEKKDFVPNKNNQLIETPSLNKIDSKWPLLMTFSSKLTDGICWIQIQITSGRMRAPHSQTLSSSELRIWPDLIGGDLKNNLVTLSLSLLPWCLDIISGFITGTRPSLISRKTGHIYGGSVWDAEIRKMPSSIQTVLNILNIIRNVMYPIIKCLNPRRGQTWWSIRGHCFNVPCCPTHHHHYGVDNTQSRCFRK